MNVEEILNAFVADKAVITSMDSGTSLKGHDFNVN